MTGYGRTTWQDEPARVSPLGAANFNNIENELVLLDSDLVGFVSLNNPPEGLTGVIGDGTTDDSGAVAAIFAYALANSRGVRLEYGNCYIAAPLTLDLASASNFSFVMVGGSFKPSTSSIGTVLSIKNGFGGRFDLNFINGGNASDYAVSILNMVMPTMNIRGHNCASTLLRGLGTTQASTKNVAVKIDIAAFSCGQALLYGPVSPDYTDFTGNFRVMDRNSSRPSTFQQTNDLTIDHYENFFNDPTQDSLIMTGCGAVHANTVALGGRALNLLSISSVVGVFSIKKLYMLGQDGGAPTTNGMTIHTSGSVVYVAELVPNDLQIAVAVDTGVELAITRLLDSGNNTQTIVVNGSSLPGFSGRRSSFNTVTEYSYKTEEFVNRPLFDAGIRIPKTGDLTKYVDVRNQSDGQVVFYLNTGSGDTAIIVFNPANNRWTLNGAGGAAVAGGVGFFGTTPPASKPAVTGSRGGNAALASLLTALAASGILTDSSSA